MIDANGDILPPTFSMHIIQTTNSLRSRPGFFLVCFLLINDTVRGNLGIVRWFIKYGTVLFNYQVFFKYKNLIERKCIKWRVKRVERVLE